jgi:hypothetical protein
MAELAETVRDRSLLAVLEQIATLAVLFSGEHADAPVLSQGVRKQSRKGQIVGSESHFVLLSRAQASALDAGAPFFSGARAACLDGAYAAETAT